MLEEARRIFAASGIQTELAETTKAGDATEMAQRANEEGRQLVIACGGDGTLNEVVNGLAGQKNGHRVPLALLPGGTANVLAKELNLPWDIPSAAEKLVHGVVRDIPLGLATPLNEPAKKKYFLSVAGSGPDGMIVYSIDLELKARVGILAYWWQGAREAFRYKFQHFRVTAGGKQVDASIIVVGRTKHYGGPFKITTEADLLEPEFELAFVTTRSAWRYLAYMPLIWLGRLRGARHVRFFKTSCLQCASRTASQVQIQVDGEPAGRLPVEFRIVPDALTLAIPVRV
jgi:diacylglycerol kinase (ATP)